MPPKDPAPTEDLLQIQIAIELDRGRKVAEIASEFQVPEKKVRNIARNAGLLESKISTSARKRLSEEEKEVLLGRIEAGEDPEELASGVGIKTSTLLRWCKVKGIEVPRRLEQLSQKETTNRIGWESAQLIETHFPDVFFLPDVTRKRRTLFIISAHGEN